MRRGQWTLTAWALLLPTAALTADQLRTVTERYCEQCHNTDDWAGGLDLSTLDHTRVGAEAQVWEKVVLKLRAGMMPPPGEDRPSPKEIDVIARQLEKRLDAEAGETAPAPTLHRLNRSEYANAIRDIFGMHVDVSALLPPDDASNGFDNVASGLGISPALIQGYTTAALKLSRAAVGDMTMTEHTVTYQNPPSLVQDRHLEGMPLGSRGGIRVVHNFPLDAEYRIRTGAGGFGGGGGFAGAGGFGGGGGFAAGGQGRGGARGNPPRDGAAAGGAPTPAAAAPGGSAGLFPDPGAFAGGDFAGAAAAGGFAGLGDLAGLAAAAGFGGFGGGGGGGGGTDLAIDGKRVEQTRDFRVRVTAGEHVLTAAVFDQRRSVGVNDIFSTFRAQGGVDSIEITGPFNATGPGDTESRRRIFICQPKSPAQERNCAERIVTNIASRAFRAPQRLEDLAIIMNFYESGRTAGGFETGIQQALSRILIDPRFLFRFEETRTTPGTAISDIQLASRLSFFLWSSIPDQQLIDLAVKQRLHLPEVLTAQVKRMLADSRAYALVENFAGQWLYLRQLATATPEVEGFDENLRQAFIEETRALVNWVFTQDRPLTELLTADYTFLNERLARHYGIPNVRGSHMRKVQLPASAHRRGLLGHGSILTITSTATRTSPVIRGAWILENILGAPPPAPPPGVETNIDGDGTKVLTTSVRQRLEQHRQNPSCGGCHGVIDPVGFALENFNAIGAWRERDGDDPVDARGTLVDGTQVAGPLDLTAALMSRSGMFVTNFTEKLMTYALGRTIDYRDMPAVRKIVDSAERDGYKTSALILGVVQSASFRQGATATAKSNVVARQ
jgi:hypothetical protein